MMSHVSYGQYRCARVPEVIGTMAFAIVSLSQFVSLYNAEAAEASFVDFPFVVHCELNGTDRAYYLSSLGADGVAVYVTPENQAGTITIEWTAKPVGGDWSGSCAGKTLEQLRSTGQAFYLQSS
jgi:hypothetical protein